MWERQIPKPSVVRPENDWLAEFMSIFVLEQPLHEMTFSKSQVAVYTAGFPCTPYSALHAFSELLSDPEARQLHQVIENAKGMKPAVTWQWGEH